MYDPIESCSLDPPPAPCDTVSFISFGVQIDGGGGLGRLRLEEVGAVLQYAAVMQRERAAEIFANSGEKEN